MSFFDFEDEDVKPSESTGAARIEKAGIHHNVEFKGIEFETGKYKNGDKKDQEWQAAKFTFQAEDGLIHEEKYFKPASSVKDLSDKSDWTPDKYKKDASGKNVKVGKLTREEYVKVLNNNFGYFLMDLGEALGFERSKVMTMLSKASDFKNCVELFSKHCCVNLEKKRISMKVLWDNNDRERKSYLRLQNTFTYYPFEGDVFDVYMADRKTALHISDYDRKNGMTRKWENERAESGSAVNEGTTSGSSYNNTQYSFLAPGADQAAGGNSDADDEDPF